MYWRTGFLWVAYYLLYFLTLKSMIPLRPFWKTLSLLHLLKILFCLRGRSLPGVTRRLQLCVNGVNKWVQENGFKFSVSKIERVHSTNQRGVFTEPDIKLDGTSIKVADEAKFLGRVFDRRLTFRAYVRYLKTVCDRALNVLRVVGHTDWGADKV